MKILKAATVQKWMLAGGLLFLGLVMIGWVCLPVGIQIYQTLYPPTVIPPVQSLMPTMPLQDVPFEQPHNFYPPQNGND